ncbi:MAG: DUF2950 domain-containing protein [Candidatus Binataceae bacterium]|nr:DUF2950 domain-containing protein [Candidatus Binataceae bacterium]
MAEDSAADMMAADTVGADTVGADTVGADTVAVMAGKRQWRDKAMSQRIACSRRNMRGWKAAQALGICIVLLFCGVPAARAQAPGQRTFGSLTKATDAFATAIQNHDEAAILAILGPSGKDLISSGDPVSDRNKQDTFTANYRASHQYAAASDGRTFLYIGPNNWPTPIPLRKNGSQWYFDTDYGKQEILYRRIGADELNVIKVCGAIVEAQRDYYNALHDGATVHQYAQKFHSTPGTQDGLYWQVKPGAQPPQSPLGPLVAQAAIDGYQLHATGEPHPFHGYVYRLLTSQGSDAPGGAQSYIVNGKLTEGFAVLAYPISYRNTGVMTFMANQTGQVYQNDLGPGTAQIASAMTAYDPDETWRPVDKATVASETK